MASPNYIFLGVLVLTCLGFSSAHRVLLDSSKDNDEPKGPNHSPSHTQPMSKLVSGGDCGCSSGNFCDSGSGSGSSGGCSSCGGPAACGAPSFGGACPSFPGTEGGFLCGSVTPTLGGGCPPAVGSGCPPAVGSPICGGCPPANDSGCPPAVGSPICGGCPPANDSGCPPAVESPICGGCPPAVGSPICGGCPPAVGSPICGGCPPACWGASGCPTGGWGSGGGCFQMNSIPGMAAGSNNGTHNEPTGSQAHETGKAAARGDGEPAPRNDDGSAMPAQEKQDGNHH